MINEPSTDISRPTSARSGRVVPSLSRPLSETELAALWDGDQQGLGFLDDPGLTQESGAGGSKPAWQCPGKDVYIPPPLEGPETGWHP